MRNIKLQFLVASFALIITNNVNAAGDTFPAPHSDLTLISETGNNSSTPEPGLYPGVATSSHHVSIPYTTTSNVATAILNICLADDLSTTFGRTIDAPMENAIVANIMGTNPISNVTFPVQPNPFSPSVVPPVITEAQVIVATNAGIENPSLPPAPVAPCINYPVDVSSIIKSEGSGTLEFDLQVSAIYENLEAPDLAYFMIVAAGNLNPPPPIFFVWEDYVYESAELVVTYKVGTPGPGPETESAPKNIPTLSEWSMILMMLGLAGFAAIRLKRS